MPIGPMPELSEKAVHVWAFPTRVPDQVMAKFERSITPDEAERAARFRLDETRNAYIVTRGFLRHLLGYYLALGPRKVQFSYTPKGKPVLESSGGINFNVTHSSEMAAIALTIGCQIGIDLEEMRSMPDAELIAKRFFCTEEIAEIMSASPGDRELAFFRCWVRKEAYIKTTGQGLFLPLDSFLITDKFGVLSPVIPLATNADFAEAWTLHDLYLAPGYASAVAYQDQERSLSICSIADPGEFFDAV